MGDLTEQQLANRVTWVRALLSKKYKQGTGRLKKQIKNEFFYCCIGVACEVIAPDAHELELTGEYEGNACGLAYMNADRAEDMLGFDVHGINQRQAGMWNDQHDYSFDRIADYIAYATAYGLSFRNLAEGHNIPSGYALDWLEEFDAASES